MKLLLCILISLATLLSLPSCGPSKPSIETTIAQTFQASNLSILSQVDWTEVMTHLEGKVGPEFSLVAEAYTKTAAGLEFRIHGGSISISTQATGTGGAFERNQAIFSELSQVQQRWERADDRAKADRSKWAEDVAEAILKALAKESATSQPSEPSE